MPQAAQEVVKARVFDDAHDREAWWSDAATLLICAMGLALVVSLLIRADERRPHARGGEAVARVIAASSEIRRRPAGTLIWERLGAGDALFEQDSVFVPLGADAQIAFADGATLEPEPNSLFVIAKREEPRAPPSVDLMRGGLVARTGASALTIRSAETVATPAENSQARIARDGDATRVEVQRGFAELATSALDATLGPEESFRVDAAGAAQAIARAPVALLAPARQARLATIGGREPVSLRFRTPAAPMAIEVALEPSFAMPIVRQAAPAGRYDFVPAGAGTYYWRVVDGHGRPASESRKFVITAEAPPVGTLPRAQDIVDASHEDDIQFAWTRVSGALYYLLEIAEDRDFAKNPRVFEAVRPQLRMPPDFKEGTYYWRVRALGAVSADDDAAGTVASSVMSFRLVTRPVPRAPELYDAKVQRQAGQGE